MDDLTVPALCSYVWWYFTKDVEEAERTKFEARIWIPPKTADPIPAKSPWSAENEMSAFAALKAETGA